MRERAGKEIKRLLSEYQPSRSAEEEKEKEDRLMESEANRVGMNQLPEKEN